MEKTEKIRINNHESPEMVIWILKNIITAIKAPSSTYVAIPGVQYFKTIEGKHQEHCFKMEHFPPIKRCDQEKIYASYDNFEFLCDLNSILFSYFCTIDNQINKKYVYDMNTDSYVLRPTEQTKIDIVLQWIRSKTR